MVTVRFIYGLIVVLLATAHSQSALAISLEEALSAAYLNNPSLKAQRAKLRSQDETVAQALSTWRPTLSLSGETGYTHSATNTTTPPLKYRGRRPSQLSLQAVQNLYRGGRSSSETRVAENGVLAERESLRAAEQDMLLRAAQSYVNLVRDEAILELRRSNESVLQKQLEATQDRFSVGEITRTDVNLAKARLAQARADSAQAVGNLEVARAAFKNVVGQDPVSVTQPTRKFDVPNDREAAIALAENNNPQVLSALYMERRARETISTVRAELAPTVDLVGSANRSLNASVPDTRTDSYGIKIVARVPLYQGGAVYSRLRQAKQLESESRLVLTQARRDAIQRASEAWDQLVSVRARLLSLEAQIEAAKVALDGVEREASVGARTILDVLDAKQELLDAQVSLVNGKRDELVSEFSLIASIGRLTAKDLALDVQYYDPMIYYNEVRQQLVGGDILQAE